MSLSVSRSRSRTPRRAAPRLTSRQSVTAPACAGARRRQLQRRAVTVHPPPAPGAQYPSDPLPQQTPPDLHRRGPALVSGIFHDPAPADSCTTERSSTTLPATAIAHLAVLADTALPEAPLRPQHRGARRRVSRLTREGAQERGADRSAARRARDAPVPGVKYPSDPLPQQTPPDLHRRGPALVSGIFHNPAPADSCVTHRSSTTLPATPTAPSAALAGRAAPESHLRPRHRLNRRQVRPGCNPGAPWMLGILHSPPLTRRLAQDDSPIGAASR